MNDFILKAKVLNFMQFFNLSTKYRDKSLKKILYYSCFILFEIYK